MAEKAGKSSKLIVFLLIGIIVLLLALGGGYLLFVKTKLPSSEAAEKPMLSTKLDTFTVNLSDSNFRRYLRVDLALEFENKKTEEVIKEKEYRIRDAIILYFMKKRSTDCGNINKIKQDVLKIINSKLDEKNQISGVYFNEFIIN
ncbi:flagellar basal body-associated FliL family protein [Bacillota bacterium LX-D]|nr:flagellar basal body-associated FliL family protein [Bacillota bacterium LX-D]